MACCDAGGVGLLDDADDLAVLRAQDAAVARRVGQRRRQHRRRGGFGAVGGDQVGQGVGVQQRNVAGGHHHGAGEVGGQGGQPAADGVPGAVLLFLHRDVDRAAQRLGQLGDGRGDAVAVMAEHHDEMLRGDLGHRVQGVRQHAAARPACAAPSGCPSASGCRHRRPAPGPRIRPCTVICVHSVVSRRSVARTRT